MRTFAKAFVQGQAGGRSAWPHIRPKLPSPPTRAVAANIGATAVPETHACAAVTFEIATAKMGSRQRRAIEGVNASVFGRLFLDGDSPSPSAAAMVLANFIREPFSANPENAPAIGLHRGCQLRRIAKEAVTHLPVQSSTHLPDDLLKRAGDLYRWLAGGTLPKPRPNNGTRWWPVRAPRWETKPKSIAENRDFFRVGLYPCRTGSARETLVIFENFSRRPRPWRLLKKTLDPATGQAPHRVVESKNLAPKEAGSP